jgi:hypothetical protein
MADKPVPSGAAQDEPKTCVGSIGEPSLREFAMTVEATAREPACDEASRLSRVCPPPPYSPIPSNSNVVM